MATSDDVTPPHSIEAEMALLGSMLVERNAIVKAADVLKPSDFYRESHRTVYSAILELSNNNVEADVITVGEALKSDRSFTDAGGPSLLIDLAERVPTALHVEHYAKIVHEKALLRDVILNARELIRDAQTLTTPVNELV